MGKQEYLNILKKNNLKITPKRSAIIDLFLNEQKFFTPREIWSSLQTDFNHLGLPTVYRILQQFQEIGLAVNFQNNDNQVYYYLCNNPGNSHHHHFICRNCRKVQCLDYCNFEVIKKTVQEQLNARVDEHFLQVEGLCSECQSE